jgi:hypothetical protein
MKAERDLSGDAIVRSNSLNLFSPNSKIKSHQRIQIYDLNLPGSHLNSICNLIGFKTSLLSPIQTKQNHI